MVFYFQFKYYWLSSNLCLFVSAANSSIDGHKYEISNKLFSDFGRLNPDKESISRVLVILVIYSMEVTVTDDREVRNFFNGECFTRASAFFIASRRRMCYVRGNCITAFLRSIVFAYLEHFIVSLCLILEYMEKKRETRSDSNQSRSTPQVSWTYMNSLQSRGLRA